MPQWPGNPRRGPGGMPEGREDCREHACRVLALTILTTKLPSRQQVLSDHAVPSGHRSRTSRDDRDLLTQIIM